MNPLKEALNIFDEFCVITIFKICVKQTKIYKIIFLKKVNILNKVRKIDF